MRNHLYQRSRTFLVHLTGIEPARPRHQILSLARLPVPPQVQIKEPRTVARGLLNRKDVAKKMPLTVEPQG